MTGPVYAAAAAVVVVATAPAGQRACPRHTACPCRCSSTATRATTGSAFHHNRSLVHPQLRRPAPPVAAAKAPDRAARRQQQLFIQVEPDGSDVWRLDPVVEMLKQGAVGIIPTDSNLAFVCDLGSRAAVEKLLEIKRARGSQKMSILCRNLQDVDTYTLGWPPSRAPGQPDMFKLVRRVLPGPACLGAEYTFILPASKELPKAMTNVDKGKSKKRHEVGVRLPDDPVAQAILQQLDRPLLCSTVASSLGDDDDDNEGSGGYGPDPAVLMDRYGPAGLDFVVDGGPRIAEGSTVIDCTGVEPVVLRLGKGDASFLEG